MNPVRLALRISPLGTGFEVDVEERAEVSLADERPERLTESLPGYRGDVWPTPGVPLVSGTTSWEIVSSAVRETGTRFVSFLGSALPKPRAILRVQQNIRLQLYEERVAATRVLTRHRLRYLRRDLEGNVVADVLLYPATVLR